MTYETRQAYAEICAVLDYMPNEYVTKIPERITKLFQTEKLENYEPNINKSNPLDKNYLSKKTMVLIAMLNYQYWCPNKKVKDELYKQYLSNNERYEKEIQEKYNTDNLFNGKKNITQIEQEKCMEMVEYKETVWRRLIKKIKKYFIDRIKFKKQNNVM